MITAVPGHVDEPDELAGLRPSCHPAQRVLADAIPPTHLRSATVGLGELDQLAHPTPMRATRSVRLGAAALLSSDGLLFLAELPSDPAQQLQCGLGSCRRGSEEQPLELLLDALRTAKISEVRPHRAVRRKGKVVGRPQPLDQLPRRRTHAECRLQQITGCQADPNLVLGMTKRLGELRLVAGGVR